MGMDHQNAVPRLRHTGEDIGAVAVLTPIAGDVRDSGGTGHWLQRLRGSRRRESKPADEGKRKGSA
jgi:hypothetical protein